MAPRRCGTESALANQPWPMVRLVQKSKKEDALMETIYAISPIKCDADSTATGVERYTQAITKLSQWLGIDHEMVLKGHAVELGGVTFSLMHYGSADPSAATLVMDYGEISPQGEELVLRHLLEYNVRSPAGAQGHFAVSPEHSRILYCMRLDLDSQEDPAEALGNLIATSIETLQKMSALMDRQTDLILGRGAVENRQHA